VKVQTVVFLNTGAPSLRVMLVVVHLLVATELISFSSSNYGFLHHGFVFQAKCFGSADIGCGGKLAAATTVAFKSARLAVGSMDDGTRQRGLADIALATMRAVNGETLLSSTQILHRGGFSF